MNKKIEKIVKPIGMGTPETYLENIVIIMLNKINEIIDYINTLEPKDEIMSCCGNLKKYHQGKEGTCRGW